MSTLVEPARATDPKHSVSVVQNLSYLSGGLPTPNKARLDLYLPRGKTRFPVIVAIHRGGFWITSVWMFMRPGEARRRRQ